jgi:hypothetical protein
MKFKIQPTQKQLSKIEKKENKSSENTGLKVPENFASFCSLLSIRSGKNIVKFDLYPYQIDLINSIKNTPNTVVLKSRQMGITETIGALFLHKACLNPGYAAVVLSRSQSDTSNVAKRVRRMLDSIPEYASAENDNLQRIKIKNGGEIFFRQSTADGCRGLESISDIFYDEWAFVKEASRIYDSSIPTTSACGIDARIIMVSTPNGKSGLYWDTLNSGNNFDIEDKIDEIRSGKSEPSQSWIDESGWCNHVCHYKAHPIYGARSNYLEEIAHRFKLSKDVVMREYDLCFQDGISNVFDIASINKALGKNEKVSNLWI